MRVHVKKRRRNGLRRGFLACVIEIAKREGENRIWKKRIFAYTDARMMRWGYSVLYMKREYPVMDINIYASSHSQTDICIVWNCLQSM